MDESFMKNSKLKLVYLALVVLLITIIPTIINAANNSEGIVLEKSSSEKIIYVKDMEETEYKYAFSDGDDTTSATYVTATKDSNGRYVAVLDNGKTYKNLFIMIGTDTSTAKIINLEKAKTIKVEEIEDIEKITKIIGVKTDESETNIKNDDGTMITTTIGKIVVTDDGKYQYQLFEVLDKNNSTKTLNSTAVELYNQLEEIENSSTMFDKLKAEIIIRDNYKTLLDNANWENAKNNKEIFEPENALKGEKFLVLIQEIDENGKTVRTDIQFMTCDRKDKAEEAVTKDKKVKKITRLPVTGESLALYIALAVVILAIIVLIIKMKKAKAQNNEEK